jgi:hypothetical protein
MADLENEDPEFSMQALLDLKVALQTSKVPASSRTKLRVEPMRESNGPGEPSPSDPQAVMKYALKGLSDKTTRSTGKNAKMCLEVAQTALKFLYESKRIAKASSDRAISLEYAAEKLHSSLVLRLIESGMVRES